MQRSGRRAGRRDRLWSGPAAYGRRAGGCHEWAAYGGIRIGNVRTIALRTGVREIHSSLSTTVKSTAYYGGADANELHGEFARFVVRESDVRAFKSALQAIALEIEAHPPV